MGRFCFWTYANQQVTGTALSVQPAIGCDLQLLGRLFEFSRSTIPAAMLCRQVTLSAIREAVQHFGGRGLDRFSDRIPFSAPPQVTGGKHQAG
jgi:hypothetical protein